MKRQNNLILNVFCFLLLGTLGAELSYGSRAKDVASRLESTFASLGDQADTSAYVLSLGNGRLGQVIYEHNSSQTLIPASVTKLVTSAAALGKWGAFFQFKTKLYYSGQRKGNTIHGDLIAVGDGDPFLVSEQLWQAAADLRMLGIEHFTGDLVIDNSLFDGQNKDASRSEGRHASTHAYDAPVSAFGINFNTVSVAIAPSQKIGQRPLIHLNPYPLRGVLLENQARTVQPGQRNNLSVTRTSVNRKISLKDLAEKITIRGQVSQDTSLSKVYRSIQHHSQIAGESLRSFLQKEGVTIAGQVREGSRSHQSRMLMEIESFPLTKIITGLNTFSNNYIADVLVKRLGASFPQKGRPMAPGQGSYANGLYAIQNFLQDSISLKPTDYEIKNGSGLSPQNRISSEQLGRLLAFMESQLEFFPEYLASLPAAGWSGTLEDRFQKYPHLKGQVRAKTGTLTQPVSVSSLAGYLRHPRAGWIAFSVIQNGKKGKGQPSLQSLQTSQDAFVAQLWQELNAL